MRTFDREESKAARDIHCGMRYLPSSHLEVHAMPFGEKAIHDGEYVLLRNEGQWTIQEYEEFTATTKRLLDERRWKRLLVDLRDITNRVSVTDIYFIVDSGKKVFPQVRIGVVFPPGREEECRFADMVADNRRVELKSFTVYEQAVAWLTTTET